MRAPLVMWSTPTRNTLSLFLCLNKIYILHVAERVIKFHIAICSSRCHVTTCTINTPAWSLNEINVFQLIDWISKFKAKFVLASVMRPQFCHSCSINEISVFNLTERVTKFHLAIYFYKCPFITCRINTLSFSLFEINVFHLTDVVTKFHLAICSCRYHVTARTINSPSFLLFEWNKRISSYWWSH